MTGNPDFRELVGEEGAPEELERLQKVHDLLLAAGPPPELPPSLERAPATAAKVSWLPRRRKEAAFVLAGAAAALAFGIGFFLGDRGKDQFEARGPALAMHGLRKAQDASASILVGDRDEVGNWPLLVRVRGLEPLPEGGWYELWLSRKRKPAAWCGAFTVRESDTTVVQFSVPYVLKDFDGWIVTERYPDGTRDRQALLTT